MPEQATVTIKNKQWDVTVAITPAELAQGLGGLDGLPAQSGMLFDMGVAQIIQVTTVPMLFPLDIIFLSESLVVTEVYRNVLPGYLVTSTWLARYFLEVNAGEVEGIDTGDQASVQIAGQYYTPVQYQAMQWQGIMGGITGVIVLIALAAWAFSIVRKAIKGEEVEYPL